MKGHVQRDGQLSICGKIIRDPGFLAAQTDIESLKLVDCKHCHATAQEILATEIINPCVGCGAECENSASLLCNACLILTDENPTHGQADAHVRAYHNTLVNAKAFPATKSLLLGKGSQGQNIIGEFTATLWEKGTQKRLYFRQIGNRTGQACWDMKKREWIKVHCEFSRAGRDALEDAFQLLNTDNTLVATHVSSDEPQECETQPTLPESHTTENDGPADHVQGQTSVLGPSTVLVARIGQGRELHPVLNDKRYGILFACSCPGTRRGGVRITWHGKGTPTCRT